MSDSSETAPTAGTLDEWEIVEVRPSLLRAEMPFGGEELEPEDERTHEDVTSLALESARSRVLQEMERLTHVLSVPAIDEDSTGNPGGVPHPLAHASPHKAGTMTASPVTLKATRTEDSAVSATPHCIAEIKLPAAFVECEDGNPTFVRPTSPERARKPMMHRLLTIILTMALAVMRMILSALCAILTLLAESLSSPTVGHLLTLAPLATDGWGLRAVAASTRLGARAFTLVRSPRGSTRITVTLLAGLSIMVTAAAVEAALLFGQPSFATLTGGVFVPGDAARAGIDRLSRAAWLSAESHANEQEDPKFAYASAVVCVLCLLSVTCFISDRLVIISQVVRAIAVAGVLHSVRTSLLNVGTYFHIATAFTSAPDGLFGSRHEFSLFSYRSVDSPIALALVLIGDLFMANAAAHPACGAGGALVLGAGLLLSGFELGLGYLLTLVAWLAYATSHFVCAQVAPRLLRPTTSASAATMKYLTIVGFLGVVAESAVLARLLIA